MTLIIIYLAITVLLTTWSYVGEALEMSTQQMKDEIILNLLWPFHYSSMILTVIFFAVQRIVKWLFNK